MRVTAPAPASVREPAPDRSVAALYEGAVRHRRNASRVRAFSPKLFMSYLDVDALPGSLDPLPLWSGRRRAPVHYRRRDFFDGADQPLGAAVRDLVAARLGRRPSGPVYLLAHLRTFGWLHNPLAAYYCWDEAGRSLDALVLEVTNTPWGERQWYVFDATGADAGRTTKAMHVSPFLPMDVDYLVSWTAPGSDLDLRVEVVRGEVTIFDAHLALRRAALDRRRALEVLERFPFMTLRVTAGIYREALRCLLARMPFYRHPVRADKETHR